jgi:hypothetical protein
MVMATEKEDTDPSSPGALRAPGYRSAADPLTADHPTTDPGLGPRSRPQLPSDRPVSVRVPAPSTRRDGPSAITPPETPMSSAAFANKDSVELLLEGMAGPRPDRRKSKPQSDGEASAAYHSEHKIRRARLASEPGPKVLIEKTPTPLPGPVSRERSATVRVSSREALSTFVPAKVLRRRVAMAVVAGTLLVLLLFVGLRLTSSGHAEVPPAATAAADTVALEPRAPRAPAMATETAGVPTPSAVRTEAPAAEGGRNAAAASKTAPGTGSSGKGKHKTQSNAPAGGDVGEFSTTF